MFLIFYELSPNKINLSKNEKQELLSSFGSKIFNILKTKLDNSLTAVAGMFLALPPEIEISYITDEEYSSILNNIEDVDIKNELERIYSLMDSSSFSPINSAYAYLKKENDIYSVGIKIHILLKEKFKDDYMNFTINTFSESREYWAFIYLHELFHIMDRDLELHNSYEGYLNKKAKQYEFTKKESREFLNYAFDYHINSRLLFSNDNIDNAIINKNIIFNTTSGIIKPILEEEYNGFKLNRFEIIDKMLKNKEGDKFKEGSNTITISIGKSGNISITLSKKNGKITVELSSSSPDPEKLTEENVDDTGKNNTPKLNGADIDNIKDAINDVVSKIKGSGTEEIFSKLGYPIEIKIDWFKKLKTSVTTDCFNKSDKRDATWSKPNIYKKHIAQIPGTIYQNRSPHVYIMIDSSGSMSDNDLRKINYLILSLIKKKNKVTVLVHDTKIIKIDSFDKKSKNIKEFVSKRYSCGGTSHKDVFDYIENNVENYNKAIIIICSDFLSDIYMLRVYGDYTWINKIKTYSLNTNFNGYSVNKNDFLGTLINIHE